MSQSKRGSTAAARSSLRPPTLTRPRGLATLCVLLLSVGQAGCGDLGLSGSGQSLPQTPLRISPTRCSVLCGVRVTIVGVDMPAFGPGTEVLFGEVLASDIEIIDAETIRVTAPSQAAGYVDVTVRLTTDAAFTSTAGFEYVTVADADAEILEQIENMFPGAPALVSAVATSNTSVRVMFSEPMGAGARDPLNYSIVIAGGGVLKIDLSEAIEHSQDGTVLDLPTLSQAHALYEMTVTGIRDLAGHPIAPPDLMDTPAFTTFTGIAPGEQAGQIDSDGDGLPDWLELLGWPIIIELADGQRVQSYVTSDPFNPDTDGDGVGDAEENARSMHPRSNDTDADLVLDAEEIWGWRSNPNDQDTDDDGFSDMLEVGFGTSLILADTDGDQLDDLDELLNRNRNPHIADLPIVDIVVGEINPSGHDELLDRLQGLLAIVSQYGESDLQTCSDAVDDLFQMPGDGNLNQKLIALGELKAKFGLGTDLDTVMRTFDGVIAALETELFGQDWEWDNLIEAIQTAPNIDDNGNDFDLIDHIVGKLDDDDRGGADDDDPNANP